MEDYGYHFPGTGDYYLPGLNRRQEEEAVLARMQNILGGHPYLGVPREPSKIARGIFLGGIADAENLDLLRRVGITHVLNCSGRPAVRRRQLRNPYIGNRDIAGYLQIDAQDEEGYDISVHFRQCCHFIFSARKAGGQVLIYGEGVSRAGAVCLAYLLYRGMYLLEATRLLKDARRTALCNAGFMRHLIRYAQDQALVDPEPNKVHGQTSFNMRGLDKERVSKAHLQDVELTKTWWRPEPPKDYLKRKPRTDDYY